MTFQALNIAASSLKSHQKAIDVVSHNISNANTPGYSRQTPSIVTEVPQLIGSLNFGRGIDLNDIQRSIDPLITSSQRANASQLNFWTTVTNGLNTVENTFGSLADTGPASSVNDLFLAWQQLSNDPQDTANKYNVRSKTESMVRQLNTMHAQLLDGQIKVDQELTLQLDNANQKIDEIATLNKKIKMHEAGQFGALGPANDLRDQRDEAIRQLATIIPIQSVQTNDGGVLLQTIGGNLLVQDDFVRHLDRSVTANSSGFQGIVVAGTNDPIQGLEEGGIVGGLIKLRDGNFQDYINTLDSFAANLAYSVNQIHASGAGNVRTSILQSGQGAIDTNLPLNDVTQTAPFASQVQAGSFNIHVYDPLGAPVSPVSAFAINVPAGATMNDIANAINTAIPDTTVTTTATGSTTAGITNTAITGIAFKSSTALTNEAFTIDLAADGLTFSVYDANGIPLNAAISATTATGTPGASTFTLGGVNTISITDPFGGVTELDVTVGAVADTVNVGTGAAGTTTLSGATAVATGATAAIPGVPAVASAPATGITATAGTSSSIVSTTFRSSTATINETFTFDLAPDGLTFAVHDSLGRPVNAVLAAGTATGAPGSSTFGVGGINTVVITDVNGGITEVDVTIAATADTTNVGTAIGGSITLTGGVFGSAGTPDIPGFPGTLALGMAGVVATVDAAGRLNLNAGPNTIAFSNDTSNFLAAYEVNSFFNGNTAAGIALSQDIQSNVQFIHTGMIDPATSTLFPGDNSATVAIMGLQDLALSVDGTTSASLHERVATLSSQYGMDVEVSKQQQSYREAEANSIIQQREAVSGVNVDEELIAMMKFQRAYEAAAKVINTNNQMLDSLMGILR